MILPDSNIWIYGIDTRLPEHPKAGAWFEQADDEIFLVPTIVQVEVVHYIARHQLEQAAQLAEDVLAAPAQTPALTRGIVMRSAERLKDHRELGIGSRDAAILAHARDHDATLVTHDEALFKAAMRHGLDAHDPILEAPA